MAAATNKFLLEISGDDKLSATIKKIDNNVKQMNRPFDRAGKLINNLTKATGIDKLNSGLTSTAAAAGDVARGVESILPALGEFVALGSLAGIADLSARWADQARHLEIVSKYTEISTGELQTWSNAATAAGLSGDAMVDSIGNLQQKLENAAWGRDPGAFALFKQMGITVDKDHIPNATDILEQVAKYSNSLEGRKGEAVNRALGISALDPMMRALPKYMEMAKKFGVVMGEDQVAAGAKFQDSINISKLAVSGLSILIGSDLALAFQPAVDGMNQWIVANDKFIAGNVTDFMKEIYTDAKGIGGAIEGVGEQLGLWKNGADAFCKVLEVSVIAAIAMVSQAIIAANARFIATPIGAFIAAGMVAKMGVEALPTTGREIIAAPWTAIQNAGIGLYNFKYGTNLGYQDYDAEERAGARNAGNQNMGLWQPNPKSLFGGNGESDSGYYGFGAEAKSLYSSDLGATADGKDGPEAQFLFTFLNAPHGTRVQKIGGADNSDVRILHSSAGY